jgi:hypothetical protein
MPNAILTKPAGHKNGVTIESFERFKAQSALKGFCTVTVRHMRLRLYGVSVFSTNSGDWVMLPTKPELRDGVIKRSNNGAAHYLAMAEWTDRETSDGFSAAVIAALDAFCPSWRGGCDDRLS